MIPAIWLLLGAVGCWLLWLIGWERDLRVSHLLAMTLGSVMGPLVLIFALTVAFLEWLDGSLGWDPIIYRRKR